MSSWIKALIVFCLVSYNISMFCNIRFRNFLKSADGVEKSTAKLLDKQMAKTWLYEYQNKDGKRQIYDSLLFRSKVGINKVRTEINLMIDSTGVYEEVSLAEYLNLLWCIFMSIFIYLSLFFC